MKYFFIAGERSGDQHASRVIAQIKKMDTAAVVKGWGGDEMQAAGAEILSHYQHSSYMGFWEVVKNLKSIQENLRKCKSHIQSFKPDVVVLVDFAGFNLRMAKYAKTLNIATCYFISPKIWAWRKSRIKQIRSYVDRMLVIFPFEVDFYKRLHYEALYVGNPSVERIQGYRHDKTFVLEAKKESKNIAFLPGSRVQEVKEAVTCIAQLSAIYDDFRFLVAAVDNVPEKYYEPLLDSENISVVYGKPYEVLKSSEVAIVTSGTASLEAALIGVPQVVVYKTSFLTYSLARFLVNVRYISLVNLVANRKVVKELIQGDYNAVEIATELEYLLNDASTKKRISEGYSEIRKLLGDSCASKNAAQEIVSLSRS